MKRSTVVTGAILIAIAVFFFYRYKVPHNVEFFSLQLQNVSGERIELKEKIEQPSIVHFYASWCGPCMKELPDAIAFAKSHADEFDFFFVTDDTPSKMINILTRFEGNPDEFYTIPSLKEISVYSIPMTYFIDENSQIKKSVLGECPWNQPGFLNEIKEYYK